MVEKSCSTCYYYQLCLDRKCVQEDCTCEYYERLTLSTLPDDDEIEVIIEDKRAENFEEWFKYIDYDEENSESLEQTERE